MKDAVMIGSVLAVVGSIIVFIFLSYKVSQLMKQDEANRKK